MAGDSLQNMDKAAADITKTISATMAQLGPQLCARYGISGRALNLAIAKAAVTTAATATLAAHFDDFTVEQTTAMATSISVAIRQDLLRQRDNGK